MSSERILLIGGWHLLSGLNHRVRHIAKHFEKRFANLDIVGYKKLYGGPPASTLAKLRIGLTHLMRDRISITSHNGIRHITIRDIYVPPLAGMGIKDLWRYWTLCRCFTAPYDVAVYGYPGNAWTAVLLKRSGRVKKLIYDDWDYHPGLESSPLNRHMVERREQLCARTADELITVNGLLANLRVKQGARNVHVIPNGLNLSLFSRAREKIPHPPTLVYMGSLSPLWNIELVIRGLPALAKILPDIRLLIAGYGPSEVSLRRLSRELGMENRVYFLGEFDYEALPSILSQADIGITTALRESSFRRYATPLKIVEYMAAGLPVIASRVGQTEIIMEDSKAGLLIGDSQDEFTQAAESLFHDSALYRRCSEAALNYAEGFDWNPLLEKACQVVIHALEEIR